MHRDVETLNMTSASFFVRTSYYTNFGGKNDQVAIPKKKPAAKPPTVIKFLFTNIDP